MTSTTTPPSSASPPSGPASTAPTHAWLPLVAVGVTLVLWASAFVAIRHLGRDFSAGPLSLGRLAVGAVALGAVALSRGAFPRPTARQWGSLVAIGVLWFGLYNIALNEGEQRVDAGTAAMLLQVSPVLIALLAATFLAERFTVHLALGLALAFSGVAVIGLASSPGGQADERDLIGVALCLVSAVTYSVSVILQKPLLARLSAIHVTWLACTIGALACLPYAGTLADEAAAAPGSSIAWVVYLGVTTYLVPPLTIVLGLLFLSEVPPTTAYVGGALALVGVAVARRKPRTSAREHPQPVH